MPATKPSKAPARRSPAKNPKSPAKAAGSAGPSEDSIRERAYEIFLARGGAPGDPQDDWAAAERELRAPKKRKVAAR